MTVESVRGAAKARAGATDTTMMIWKVIDANPGIEHYRIWKQVEHAIPASYALRRFGKTPHGREITIRQGALSSDSDLERARRWVLRNRLWEMCRNKSIEQVGDGYCTLRDIRYKGNVDAIDPDGSKAAEHMAVASALRIAEKVLAKPYKEKSGTIRSQELYDAVTVMVKALRARQPGSV